MPLRICAVSFADVRGIRHTVEVQAESLFEAAILGVRTFRGDPWIEHVGPATVLDIEVREPAAKHAITMMQVERVRPRSTGFRRPRKPHGQTGSFRPCLRGCFQRLAASRKTSVFGFFADLNAAINCFLVLML